MKKNILQKNRGFTLVETLVAISIFSLSVLGIMSVLSQGIKDTNYSKRKITATYLAQEGVEYVRNMRDTYVLFDATDPQAGWNDGFLNKFQNCQAIGCYIEDEDVSYIDNSQPIIDVDVRACGDATCSSRPLLYNETTGKYGYVSGINSGYYRKIQVVPITDGDGEVNEVKIISTVYWSQGSGSYNVSFSESLFNWL
jgi:prepilin-type N-terminal cleavage/methylation domain-containing protein